MNRNTWRLQAMLIASVLAATAFAQDMETTTGSTTLVETFSLTKQTDLSFGSVLPPTSGSNTVLIDAGGGGRSLDGAGNGALVGSGGARATYTVDGDGGQVFDINVPATVTLTRASGTETIVVTLVPSGATGELSGTPGTAGSDTFAVGGSLPVASGTVPGLYQGSFVVSVDNN